MIIATLRKLTKMGKFISGRADKGNLEKWSRYSSDNSWHAKSKAEKMGNTAPSEQNVNKGNYTARETKPCCGNIGKYPKSGVDRG